MVPGARYAISRIAPSATGATAKSRPTRRSRSAYAMSAAPQKAKAQAVSYCRCGTPTEGVGSTSWCQAAITQPETARTTAPTAAKRIADHAATRGTPLNFIRGRPGGESEAEFYLGALGVLSQ